MKTYQMWRDPHGHGRAVVYSESGSASLHPYSEIWDFSGGILEWGCQVRGADQLALALILDATHSADLAFRYWEEFRAGVLDKVPVDGTTMSEEFVLRWLLYMHAQQIGLPLVVRLGGDAWEDSHARN